MKTPFVPLTPENQTQGQNPFNRMRWIVNETEGKWDAAVRAMFAIQRAPTIEEAKRIATETLIIMSRTGGKTQ